MSSYVYRSIIIEIKSNPQIYFPYDFFMRQCNKRSIVATGFNNEHHFLTIVGNCISQFSTDENGIKTIIRVNVRTKTMKVYSVDENNGSTELDLCNLMHNGIFDMSNEGDRWEGDLLNGYPFGWGQYYDSDNFLLYEGFIYEKQYVCYGNLFHKCNHQIRYSGMFYNGTLTGYGILFKPNGEMMAGDCWIQDHIVSSILKASIWCEDTTKIHSLLKVISIGNHSYNHNTLTKLSFSYYPYLNKLVIGNNCCKYVEQFSLIGVRNLRLLIVGKSSFFHMKVGDNVFICKNCPLLQKMVFDEKAFAFYSQFTVGCSMLCLLLNSSQKVTSDCYEG